MPAVTADTLTLPRIPAATLGDTERPVRSVTTGPRGFEGEGFPVVRAFAGVPTAELDPFVHMDQMGEVDYAPGEPKGTAWHPHRGFETVTYMIDGTFQHQDTHGGGGVINDGATQWMTAGGGILHIETPPEELVDVRRAVPRRAAVGQPAGQGQVRCAPVPGHRGRARPPWSRRADGGALLRVSSAGSSRRPSRPGLDPHADHDGPRHRSARRAALAARGRADFNALVYVLSGDGTVGADGAPDRTAASWPSSARGDRITARRADAARTRTVLPSRSLLLGGRPIREPVAHYGRS